jgi:4-diphosphocytidyl-2-C-methyl-D-erythritol kinase
LQSVFQLIDWYDTLHFSLRNDGIVSREDLTWELPIDDLAVRAARSLQKHTGCALGVHIGMAKSVPAQAGMGGGSSDAASTLLALNRLWGLNLPVQVLSRIGVELGADVPFFLLGRNAWVEGIGDQLRPIDVPATRFVVVKPEQGLDTKAIFAHPLLKRDTEAAILEGFVANTFGYGRNDLQAVAQALCPGVNQALNWLISQGLAGRMTGSGSAVFARALQDIDLAPAPAALQVRLCSSLEVHPLDGWASSKGLSVGSV